MTFIDRIAASAAADPHGIAIREGERAVTYEDLWNESGLLADRLRTAGLGPGSRVVLTGGRSSSHVISALGVWRSGCAIVPMDPSYSALRLEQMRRAAAPAATVHTDGSVERHGDPARQDDSAPLGLERSKDDCYYIFTSGSTGRPKGIAMPRAVVDNLVDWQVAEFGRIEHPRIPMFASVSFDVSIQETCSALACGGSLVVVPEEVRGRPDLLLGWLRDYAIDVFFLPYAALQMLASQAASSPLTGQLRLAAVFTGGETMKCTPDIVRMFTRLPGTQLGNQYGPSETHVVTSFSLTGDPATWPALPPIGTPIPGAEITLRDADGAEVLAGEPGELCVGGVAVARGYVGQDAGAATARQFAGGYYRTGDQACVRDGQLCFIGRHDHQVKISGYRVEPDAVEYMLLEHPAVRNAVCLAVGRDALSRTLVAIVAGGADQAALRAFLSARLPPPMVPRQFVVVDALPLTPSGKVDRLRAAELLSQSP